MAVKLVLIALSSLLVVSCTNFDDHQLKVEKNAESLNGVKFSISLIGNDQIHCKGIIKYNNIPLHQFTIDSYNFDSPSEFLINYSNFPNIGEQLATDFVLERQPHLEILIQNRDNEFYRTEYLALNPKIPPIITGIKLLDKEISKKFPIGFRQEISNIDFYLFQENVSVNNYTLEQITTVSVLIKNNTKILQTVVPAGETIHIYKGKKYLQTSVLCDSVSFNPHLILYPSLSNKYYDGPNLYEIAKAHYTEQNKAATTIKMKSGKYLLEQNFYVEQLIGEYDLFLILSEGENDYFYYDLGSIIFDNIAPEFNKWIVGNHHFRGNGLFEGKVYLDYSILWGGNPYEVVFSGKVYGDVANIAVDGQRINFKRNSDLIFSKKIYIQDGYKDVNIKISDGAGNLKNYTLPLILSQ
jgi:hypothetical protein